jgi:metal-responsive CopG/Arc/MetJ family transcriptional regulator
VTLSYAQSGKSSEAQVTVLKHPVSIALSNRVLEKIDKEASKQKRSRSEYVELTFKTLLFENLKSEKIISIKTK